MWSMYVELLFIATSPLLVYCVQSLRYEVFDKTKKKTLCECLMFPRVTFTKIVDFSAKELIGNIVMVQNYRNIVQYDFNYR